MRSSIRIEWSSLQEATWSFILSHFMTVLLTQVKDLIYARWKSRQMLILLYKEWGQEGTNTVKVRLSDSIFQTSRNASRNWLECRLKDVHQQAFKERQPPRTIVIINTANGYQSCVTMITIHIQFFQCFFILNCSAAARLFEQADCGLARRFSDIRPRFYCRRLTRWLTRGQCCWMRPNKWARACYTIVALRESCRATADLRNRLGNIISGSAYFQVTTLMW